MIEIQTPYLLFLGDAPDQLSAKTADGVAHWCKEKCVGQLRLSNCRADVGLTDISLEAARAKGAKTLVVGVANRGGVLSNDWLDTLFDAIDSGFDIASGLHGQLSHIPELRERAKSYGTQLIDVRHTDENFPIANGKKRLGKRMLTVGTDCSVGKMFTTLAMERTMKEKNFDVTFRASGQTGIFIAGEGICIDAIISDFVAGAAEVLSPENEPDHWDLIEGQGSLFHASYAGVSMGLLHGSQPDALILCHDPDREHMRGLPNYDIPKLRNCISLNEKCGRLTNPDCQVVGVSINTNKRDSIEAHKLLNSLEKELGLPCVDPIRQGAERLVESLQF